MAALSLFCERACVDYLFETCIVLPTYIVPLVNPHNQPQQKFLAFSPGSKLGCQLVIYSGIAQQQLALAALVLLGIPWSTHW